MRAIDMEQTNRCGSCHCMSNKERDAVLDHALQCMDERATTNR